MEHKALTFKEACGFVTKHHRHHKPPQGHKFSVGAYKNGELVGVVIVGRPIGRYDDDGETVEVTRLATDGTRNACSFLYGVARRAAWALGYSRVITFTLDTEDGASLKASGWNYIGIRGGKSWSVPSRPREDKSPRQMKKRWEVCRD